MASMGKKSSFVAVIVLCLGMAFREVVGVLRPGEKIFNVMDFHATPGEEKDSSEAFTQAWVAACKFPGFARVLVPEGVYKVTELMFSGPCKSKIIFQIKGIVKADTDLSNYPNQGWISFDNVEGLVLTGGGTIDAQGQINWKYNDCKANPSCVHLPATLYLSDLKASKIHKIHLVNSMGFHMHVTECDHVAIHGMTITAPEDSPNTDGLHISKSQSIKVARSTISTGDDCISIGHGSSNITVRKVMCGPGHGISIGSLGKKPNEMDVRGVIVKNCTLTGTTNGVRIKTWRGSTPSTAAGLLFSNINMNNVENPIIIDQSYGSRSGSEPSRVKISDVVYQDIEGTTDTPTAVNIMCSEAVRCDNLRFRNINLRFSGINSEMLTSACANAQVDYFGPQFPPPCRAIS
ncbi:Polygalacturonase [Bertholletia excelsa]